MEKISLFNYSEQYCNEVALDDIGDLVEIKDKSGNFWIDVSGVEDKELVLKIAEIFNFHPLVTESIFDVKQRPTMDDIQGQIYVAVNMLYYNEKKQYIEVENTSLVIGKNYLISFQDGIEGDVWGGIRNKLRAGKSRIHKSGPDYLAYNILDAIIDQYFVILEHLGDKIESLEQEVIMRPEPNTLRKIYTLKREMVALRKTIWPVREMINSFNRTESTLVTKNTKIYMRDLYDHTVQIIDTIELYREMLIGMLDIYLSSVSNNLNTVMKVLTVIATIFIPLTFISSIYGMNFEYMPELKWKYGYLAVWIVMISMAAGMLAFFKKKKWY